MFWYVPLFFVLGFSVSQIGFGNRIVVKNSSNDSTCEGDLVVNGITVTKRARVIGSGVLSRQKVDLKSLNTSISSVDVGCVIAVKFIQSDEESLEIEADDNLQEYLIAKVHGNNLKIDFSTGSFQPKTPIVCYLSLRSLNKIKLSGSSSFEASRLISDNLELDLSGSSTIHANIQTKRLTADISGASNVKISGEAQSQSIDVSGASQYDGKCLASKFAEIGASGAARVKIDVSTSLRANVSGASSLHYWGRPDSAIHKSGAAFVKKG